MSITPQRWYLTWIQQILTLTGYKIIATTVQPCHLWMRWTLVPPRIHKIPVTTRGLTTMSDFYYCFDVWEDNEQLEEGDTLIHTFIKEPWPVCETRYFYFHGTIDGVNSPSTSAIFTKHRYEPVFTKLRPFNSFGGAYTIPDPNTGEWIPDDAATYREFPFGTSGYEPHWIERHPEEENFPIKRIDVYMRWRQPPGDSIAHQYARPGIVRDSPRRLYFPSDWHLSTNEWETYDHTFWTNPYTELQWHRHDLDFFGMAIELGYNIVDPGVWGKAQLTWLQVHIWPA